VSIFIFYFTYERKVLRFSSEASRFVLFDLHHFLLGFTLSQATKALKESKDIALLYFRPLH